MLSAAAGGGACLADEQGISARHHSWGRFEPGAWKVVRVVTETYDDHGALASTNIAETKTTLRKVDADGVTLEVEVGMEVAGKQFAAQPQCLKQGFHGELLSSDLRTEPPRPGQVVIEGRKIPLSRPTIAVLRREQDPGDRVLLGRRLPRTY